MLSLVRVVFFLFSSFVEIPVRIGDSAEKVKRLTYNLDSVEFCSAKRKKTLQMLRLNERWRAQIQKNLEQFKWKLKLE